jgi:hypothetical protein
LPEPWIGASRLLAGLASDLSGHRRAALDWYGLAEQLRFNGRDAARLCRVRACTREDIDRPPRPLTTAAPAGAATVPRAAEDVELPGAAGARSASPPSPPDRAPR